MKPTVMNSSLVLSLVLVLWVTYTFGLPFTGSCDSCGRECMSACGTRGFRTCCLNYLKKRSTPLSTEPETKLHLMMVLPELTRHYSSMEFLIPATGDRNQMKFLFRKPLLLRKKEQSGVLQDGFETVHSEGTFGDGSGQRTSSGHLEQRYGKRGFDS